MEICEEDANKIKKIKALMKETGAVEIQMGDYKLKKRKKIMSINQYLKNNLSGIFRFLKRRKK